MLAGRRGVTSTVASAPVLTLTGATVSGGVYCPMGCKQYTRILGLSR